MRRHYIWISVVLLFVIQLIPVRRDNPPPDRAIEPPENVRVILKRACFDCHSHETRWPWYAYVAPVSWLISYDVHEAREHLNFSSWAPSRDEARWKIREIREEVEKGEMPLWYYVPLHPAARLSDADRRILESWARAQDVPDDHPDDEPPGTP